VTPSDAQRIKTELLETPKPQIPNPKTQSGVSN